jgi:succinate dehydrogenase / fumarate reductase cytochrome b subunit
MTPVARFLTSSIGTKIVMAATGTLLILFLVAHVLGNLEVFWGRDAMNHYGELLRTFPGMLWVARAGLLALAVLHIISAARVARLNRMARPERYARKRNQVTTIFARTMVLSGIALAAFIVFHILHFTVRSIEPAYQTLHDASGRHDIFGMVVDAFQRPLVTAIYLIAMLLLGMHLAHGVSSAVHTLGAEHPRYRGSLRHAGTVVAALIVLGFIAVPLSVLAGWVRP